MIVGCVKRTRADATSWDYRSNGERCVRASTLDAPYYGHSVIRYLAAIVVAVDRPWPQGRTHSRMRFRRFLRQAPNFSAMCCNTNKMTPLASWREARDDPKHSTIIVFGMPAFLFGFIEDSVTPDIKLKQFLDNGGNLLIATDHEWKSQGAGDRFHRAHRSTHPSTSLPGAAYRGEPECPFLQYDLPDFDLDLGAKEKPLRFRGKGPRRPHPSIVRLAKQGNRHELSRVSIFVCCMNPDPWRNCWSFRLKVESGDFASTCAGTPFMPIYGRFPEECSARMAARCTLPVTVCSSTP